MATPLTDAEVDALEQQGFVEGDVVPGRGRLTPFGTFDPVPTATAPSAPTRDSSGFTLSGIFINSDGSINYDKSKDSGKSILDSQKQTADLRGDQSSGAVASSDSVVEGERQTALDINRLTNGVDFSDLQAAHNARINEIELQAKQLEERRQREIAEINNRFNEIITSTKGAQERERGTFQSTLARIGGFLGESASATGALNNLSAEHRSEIASLESKRQAAISAANAAIDDEQFDLAREKANEARSLEEDIDKRRNEFFDQALSLIKEERLQNAEKNKIVNQLRDDARTTLNTIISNFGTVPLGALDDEGFNDFAELAALAGMPLELFANPTLKEQAQVSTEQQRAITNALSAARLELSERSFNLSAARFNEAQKLDALDAQRLGLPRELVGLSENDVLAQLRSDVVPDWFVSVEEGKAGVELPQDELDTLWQQFRTEVLTTNPLVDFGGIGLPPAVSG